MWQEDSFSPELIDRELGFAARIGMKIMRVYLHDLIFDADAEGFLKRMEQFLAIAADHGMKIIFVFFDDCWNSTFSLGKQPDPLPFTHNSGWVQSPGIKAAGDLQQFPRLEKYLRSVIRHFANDQRILMWDLYNEPGNGESGDNILKDSCPKAASMRLLKAAFSWARMEKPSQPLTAGIWCWGDVMNDLNQLQLNESDVISFHSYGKPEVLSERVQVMRFLARDKAVICTEFMARTAGSTFEGCLPLLEYFGTPAVCWGLVKGKSNTTYPWHWNKEKGEPPIPFHDVFNPDGSLLCPEEQKIFDKFERI